MKSTGQSKRINTVVKVLTLLRSKVRNVTTVLNRRVLIMNALVDEDDPIVADTLAITS